jgi:hypothetical protein
MEGKLNSVSKELGTITKQICETKEQIDNEQDREHRRRNIIRGNLFYLLIALERLLLFSWLTTANSSTEAKVIFVAGYTAKHFRGGG